MPHEKSLKEKLEELEEKDSQQTQKQTEQTTPLYEPPKKSISIYEAQRKAETHIKIMYNPKCNHRWKKRGSFFKTKCKRSLSIIAGHSEERGDYFVVDVETLCPAAVEVSSPRIYRCKIDGKKGILDSQRIKDGKWTHVNPFD